MIRLVYSQPRQHTLPNERCCPLSGPKRWWGACVGKFAGPGIAQGFARLRNSGVAKWLRRRANPCHTTATLTLREALHLCQTRGLRERPRSKIRHLAEQRCANGNGHNQWPRPGSELVKDTFASIPSRSAFTCAKQVRGGVFDIVGSDITARHHSPPALSSRCDQVPPGSEQRPLPGMELGGGLAKTGLLRCSNSHCF